MLTFPNLPTDNLNKFCVMLVFVIMFYGLFLMSDSAVDYYIFTFGAILLFTGELTATVYIKKWRKLQNIQDRLSEIQLIMAEKE